jgi:hypothetical protein
VSPTSTTGSSISPSVSPTTSVATSSSPSVSPTFLPSFFPSRFSSLSPTVSPSFPAPTFSDLTSTALCDLSVELNLGWDCTTGVPVDPCSWDGVGCDSGAIISLEFPPSTYSGFLPSSFGNMKSLKSLVFYSNDIMGPLPSSISDLKDLDYLDVHNNSIALPPARRLQDTIMSLRGSADHFDHRQLADIYIDPSFYLYAEMSSLTYLDISDNDYSGQVPSMLCNLPLESLILVSLSTTPPPRHENHFTCIAKCLRDSSNLNLILPASLPTCVESTDSPTPSPTVLISVRSSTNSGTPLSSGAISGVAIGGMFFLCLLCGCCYYSLLIRDRSALPYKESSTWTPSRQNHSRDDDDIIRVSSVNVMNLRDIHESSSTSSSNEKQKKGRNHHHRHVSFGMNGEGDGDDDDDSAEEYFQSPTNHQSSASVWSEELTDFQKGSINLVKLPMGSPEFTFGDVYTSSSDGEHGNGREEEEEESVYPLAEVDDESTHHRYSSEQSGSFQSQRKLQNEFLKQNSAEEVGVQDLYPDNMSDQISALSNDDLLSVPSFEITNSPVISRHKVLQHRSSDSHSLRPQQQQLLASLHRTRSGSMTAATAAMSPQRRHSGTSLTGRSITSQQASIPPSLPPVPATPEAAARGGGENHKISLFPRVSDGSVGSHQSHGSMRSQKNRKTSERMKMERTPSEQFQL